MRDSRYSSLASLPASTSLASISSDSRPAITAICTSRTAICLSRSATNVISSSRNISSGTGNQRSNYNHTGPAVTDTPVLPPPLTTQPPNTHSGQGLNVHEFTTAPWGSRVGGVGPAGGLSRSERKFGERLPGVWRVVSLIEVGCTDRGLDG